MIFHSDFLKIYEQYLFILKMMVCILHTTQLMVVCFPPQEDFSDMSNFSGNGIVSLIQGEFLMLEEGVATISWTKQELAEPTVWE